MTSDFSPTHPALHMSKLLTCSSLSALCVRLFLPLSPAEPSGPGRELSTGVFIPAVIWASISSKLLHRETERDLECSVLYVMDEMAKFRDAAEADNLHVLHTLNHDGL